MAHKCDGRPLKRKPTQFIGRYNDWTISSMAWLSQLALITAFCSLSIIMGRVKYFSGNWISSITMISSNTYPVKQIFWQMFSVVPYLTFFLPAIDITRVILQSCFIGCPCLWRHQRRTFVYLMNNYLRQTQQ